MKTHWLRLHLRYSVLSILIFPTLVRSQTRAPDLILYNGKIFTSTVARPYVQAVAIRSERIVATGDSAKVLTIRGPATKLMDLGGRTVIPGINDAHVHLDITPGDSADLDLKDSNPTRAEVIAAIAAKVSSVSPGTTLMATIGPIVYFDPEMTRNPA